MFQGICTAKDGTPLSRSRFQWRHVTLNKVRGSPDECYFCLFTQMGKEDGTEASNENAGLSYIAAAPIVHIVHLCQSSVIHHHASSIATCRRPQELCTLCNSVCIPSCVHITLARSKLFVTPLHHLAPVYDDLMEWGTRSTLSQSE